MIIMSLFSAADQLNVFLLLLLVARYIAEDSSQS